jgi:hypothetical protein
MDKKRETSMMIAKYLRRATMPALAGLLAFVASIPPALAAGGQTVHVSSFERGFRGWTPDHFIACEQEEVPCGFNWSITRSTDRALHGAFSLKATLDGTNDDGSIWVERRFLGPPGSLATIHLSFWLWSPTQADINTWPVLAFLGGRNPQIEEDFAIIGQTEQARGWTRYSYQKTVKVGDSGVVWAAFGLGATSEFERTYYLDLVRVFR